MKPCTRGAISALRELHKTYSKLHDMLSDCIEGGRLSAAALPDDYAAIVEQITRCVAIDYVLSLVFNFYEEELGDEKVFLFSLDPGIFKKQRMLLTLLLDGDMKDASMDFEPLEGIRNLLDAIADQAHDWYGMDTLFLTEGDHEP
jgi:hypothetical protein